MSDTRIIKPGDTLAHLAAFLYGKQDRWTQLARKNKLRPPYISDNPNDQLGPLLAMYPLRTDTPQNIRSLAVTGGDPALILPGVQIVLERLNGATGQLLRVACTCTSYTAGSIQIDTALPFSFPFQTLVQIYAPTYQEQGRVLRTGDILYIPSTPDDTDQIVTLPGSDQTFDRDIACDANGILELAANGDFILSQGIANLQQQLFLRLQTVPGQLKQHILYGCRAEQFLGEPLTPVLVAHIKSWILLALGQDERVGSITFLQIQQQSYDSLFITFTIQPYAESSENETFSMVLLKEYQI